MDERSQIDGIEPTGLRIVFLLVTIDQINFFTVHRLSVSIQAALPYGDT
jgi:hypothetical protein